MDVTNFVSFYEAVIIENISFEVDDLPVSISIRILNDILSNPRTEKTAVDVGKENRTLKKVPQTNETTIKEETNLEIILTYSKTNGVEGKV